MFEPLLTQKIASLMSAGRDFLLLSHRQVLLQLVSRVLDWRYKRTSLIFVRAVANSHILMEGELR